MAPNSTAVIAALNRAAHLAVDDPPPVFADPFALALASDPVVLRGLGFDIPSDTVVREDGWLFSPRALSWVRGWRGTLLARARCLDDHIDERRADGVDQLVFLGAGLDTTGLRRDDLADVAIFEVDEPATQAWKRTRLTDLGIVPPSHLRFVPVDFEAGQSWLGQLAVQGFDPRRPAVFASTGVSQYISRAAMEHTMRDVAAGAPGTSLLCTYVLPAELVGPEERELRRASEDRSRATGSAWVTTYRPEEIAALAEGAGFTEVHHVSPASWDARYLADRSDGLSAAAGEPAIIATRD
jgi:methyltransferase (TIGR00027 family)